MTKVLRIFFALLSLSVFSTQLPVENVEQTMYDAITNNCTSASKALPPEFAQEEIFKKCSSWKSISALKIPSNPGMKETNSILCILYFNAFTSYCNEYKDSDIKIEAAPKVVLQELNKDCADLKDVSSKLQWSPDLVKFLQNEDLCSVICHNSLETCEKSLFFAKKVLETRNIKHSLSNTNTKEDKTNMNEEASPNAEQLLLNNNKKMLSEDNSLLKHKATENNTPESEQPNKNDQQKQDEAAGDPSEKQIVNIEEIKKTNKTIDDTSNAKSKEHIEAKPKLTQSDPAGFSNVDSKQLVNEKKTHPDAELVKTNKNKEGSPNAEQSLDTPNNNNENEEVANEDNSMPKHKAIENNNPESEQPNQIDQQKQNEIKGDPSEKQNVKNDETKKTVDATPNGKSQQEHVEAKPKLTQSDSAGPNNVDSKQPVPSEKQTAGKGLGDDNTLQNPNVDNTAEKEIVNQPSDNKNINNENTGNSNVGLEPNSKNKKPNSNTQENVDSANPENPDNLGEQNVFDGLNFDGNVPGDLGNDNQYDEINQEIKPPEAPQEESPSLNANENYFSKSKVTENKMSDYPPELNGDSYFFSYFMVICIFVVLAYVVYHNKQKILALIIEGRQTKRQYRGRRPNSANYHKLDSNLEEAISSNVNKNPTTVIY